MLEEVYPFKISKLEYPYNSLEPYISEEIMYYHHNKHLKTYIDNLNSILQNYPMYQNLTLDQMLRNLYSFPEEIREKIQNNAGGVYNHNLYFKILNPYFASKNEENKLLEKINVEYKSLDKFLDTFKNMSKTVFGSGYTFLVLDKFNNLKLVNTPNQNTPFANNLKPIFLIDLWEHAYYLEYKNLRDEYIDNFVKLINFDIVNQIYLKTINF